MPLAHKRVISPGAVKRPAPGSTTVTRDSQMRCQETAARHVLFIHQNFVTAKQGGNSRAVHLLKAFAAYGFHVDVVTGNEGYLGNTRRVGPETLIIEQEDAATIHRLPLGLSDSYLAARARHYSRFLNASVSYSRRLPEVDVLYCTTPPLPQVLSSLFVSCTRGRPLVLEVRDLWPAFLCENGLLKSWVLIKGLEFIEALIYAYADHCVVVAPAFKDYLIQMGVSAENIVIAPTGADPVYSQPAVAEALQWRTDQGLLGKFLILYSGSFNELYALSHVLKAAAALALINPDIHWVFVGNGRHRETIAEAALRIPTVHLYGLVPKHEVVPMQHAADVGLVSLLPTPLLKTVIPGKLFDYLAAGLPVLSTVGGQTGEILDRAGAGWVCESADPADFVSQVQMVAALPAAARQTIGAAGKAWVEQHMSSTAIADQVAALMDQVLNRSQPGRLARVGRLARASVAAAWAIVSGRTARAQRILVANGGSVIQNSFAEWLTSQRELNRAVARCDGLLISSQSYSSRVTNDA